MENHSERLCLDFTMHECSCLPCTSLFVLYLLLDESCEDATESNNTLIHRKFHQKTSKKLCF